MAQDFTLKMERFEGLRCSADETDELSLSESPEMVNFKITKGYKLTPREGYLGLCHTPKKIRGIYCAHFGEKKISMAVIESTLYASEKGFSHISPLEGEIPGDEKVSFFPFCGEVYILTGKGIVRFDGEQVTIPEPYVPLLTISTRPDGSGTIYEEVNLLTRKVRQKFSPDGQSHRFYPILNKIKRIDWVKHDGILLETDQYMWDDTNRAFYFVVAFDEGIDSLEVQYEIAGEDPSERILNCRFASAFGGASDTRAFLYGNKESAGVRYHSGIVEGKPTFSYFPETAFSLVGTGDAITSIVRHYDRQLIFTSSGAYYSFLEYMTGSEGRLIAAFPVLPLNEDRGCVPFGQALLVENTPVTLTENGLFSWVSTNIRDERNAKLLSDPINLILCQEKVENALLFNHKKNTELYICVDTHVYVYNYGLKVFYYYDLPPIRGFTEGVEGICFHTDSGIFYLGGNSDEGAPIRAFWRSKEIYFSEKEKMKRLFGMTLLASGEEGDLKVSLVTSPDGETRERELHFSPQEKRVKKKMRVPLRRFSSLRIEISREEETFLHLSGIFLKGRILDSEERK